MISISILEADILHLADEVDRSLLAGADSIHMDFLDCGNETTINLASNISQSLYSLGVRCSISVLLSGSVTVEIMELLVSSGVNYIYFNSVIDCNDYEFLSLIKRFDCNFGIVLSSDFPINKYRNFLKEFDGVLFNFEGNNMNDISCKFKSVVKDTKEYIKENGFQIQLAASGHAVESNVRLFSEFGVDIFIIGKSIFSSVDYYTTLAQINRKVVNGKASGDCLVSR